MRFVPSMGLLMLVMTAARASDPGFQILDIASDTGSPAAVVRTISADGLTVVGSGAKAPFLGSPTAFRASNGVVTWLAPLSGSGSGSSRAYTVSANGAVVAGSSTRFNIEQAVRWVNGGITPSALGLPEGWTSSTAFGVSDDGLVIAGVVRKSVAGVTVRQPFRWTSATGVLVLAAPTNGLLGTFVLDDAVLLSADGSTVVARASFMESNQVQSVAVYRWVGAGDPEALETNAGLPVVTGLAADGLTVVGSAGNQACKWDGLVLHPLFDNGVSSSAVAVSADGSRILAQTDGVAVRWSAGGVEVLGAFSPRALSADGMVAAGLRTSALRAEAMVWDSFNGVRSWTDLNLQSFTNVDVARYRMSSVVGVRQTGGRVTLAGNATGPVNPYQSSAISHGWVGTFSAPTSPDPDPFDGPLFARTSVFTPTATLSESLRHTLITTYSDGFTVLLPRAAYASQLNILVSLEGLDVTTFNTNTPVQIVAGCLALSATLGQDPAYVPGKSSATIHLRGAGALRMSWTAKVLTLSVKTAMVEGLGEFSPYFDPLRVTSVAVPGLMSRNSPGSGYLNLAVNFAGRTGRRPLFLSWTAARRTVTRQNDDYTETFYLNQVAVRGQLDYAPPTLRFIAPAGQAMLTAPSVPVALAASDLGTITQVQVSLNEGAYAPAALGEHGSQVAWLRTVSPQPGWNTLRAKAVDYSGNESRVVTNRFVYLYRGGVYAGLLTGNEGEPRGVFSITLTEGGAFSGKAVLDGASLRFQGALTESSTAEVVIGDKVLRFSLALDGAANVLTGTLTRSGEAPAHFAAARRWHDGINTLSPRRGSYTLLFPPASATNTPAGYGFAKLLVRANGSATMVGRLADGVAFTAAAIVDSRDEWPLYVRPYVAGVLAGPLRFHAGPITGIEGTLRWIKPPQRLGRFPTAFSVELPALGSALGDLDYNIFLPRDNNTGANARLRFSDGGLVSPLEQQVIAGGSLYPLAPPSASFALKSTSDGLFTGSFRDPVSNKIRSFRGAILANPPRAAGFFLGEQTGGTLELLPGYQ